MWIMNEREKELINCDHVQRFCIVKRSDAVLIVASYAVGDASCATVAKYKTVEEAKEALADLHAAICDNERYYVMIPSTLWDEEERKRDARVKRKGGS